MGSAGGSETSMLLRRLREAPGDSGVWSDFVRRYGPSIYRWSRGWGLADADAQDVTQNVLAKLYVRLPSFVYDRTRSFRAWLKTLTHHAWRDYLDSRSRPGQGSGGDTVAEALNSLPARDDLARRLEEEYDLELLAEATRAVRGRVAAHTWEAYRLLTEEGLSTDETAARLGVQPSMVLVAKSRVLKWLREEIRCLDEHVEA
jgi:RNA polymerase sigma-70 factor (ECF subfamily)